MINVMKVMFVDRVLLPVSYSIGYCYGVLKGFFLLSISFAKNRSGEELD